MSKAGFVLVLLFVLIVQSAFALGGDIPETTARPPARKLSPADQPFSTFRQIDALLTRVDHDTLILRSRTRAATKLRNRKKRAHALNAAQQSVEMRDLLRSSRKLIEISRRSEVGYKKTKKRYGMLLFRDLHRKALAIRAPIRRARQQPTLTGFQHQQRRISNSMLSFVLQFQAVSGGYGALACRPGGWSCCRPRLLTEGGHQMRGCSWICASKSVACKGGCLGPKTPDVAVAVQTSKPRIPAVSDPPKSKVSSLTIH
jgi:hypothetical protein